MNQNYSEQNFIAILNKERASFGDWILYWPTVKAPESFMQHPDSKCNSKQVIQNTSGFAIIGQSKRYEVASLSSDTITNEIHKVAQTYLLLWLIFYYRCNK